MRLGRKKRNENAIDSVGGIDPSQVMPTTPVLEDADSIINTDASDSQFAQAFEGYYDYKDFMINPASAHAINQILNRDLQLGNLSEKDYKIVFGHMHLGFDLNNFPQTRDAAKFILERGLTHLIMSNSKNGFLRKTEATSIKIHDVKKSEVVPEKKWMSWRK